MNVYVQRMPAGFDSITDRHFLVTLYSFIQFSMLQPDPSLLHFWKE